MKYVKKLPVADKGLMIWKPRNLALATLLSFPFALLLGGMTLWLAYLLEPRLLDFISLILI